jgi:hypothetical protein
MAQSQTFFVPFQSIFKPERKEEEKKELKMTLLYLQNNPNVDKNLLYTVFVFLELLKLDFEIFIYPQALL